MAIRCAVRIVFTLTPPTGNTKKDTVSDMYTAVNYRTSYDEVTPAAFSINMLML